MMKLVTQKNINRAVSLVVVFVLISCFTTFAFATATTAPADPFAGTPTTAIMSNILQIIYRLFQYVGVILAVWGVGQLLLSIKNDDADSKSRAIKIIVAAVAAIGIGTLARTIGLESLIAGTV